MARLALLGGRPVTRRGYRVRWPEVDERDVRAVCRVVRSGGWWRYSGREVERFEREFGRFHQARHVLAVCNGTVALQAALRALGVEAGDEVIVPAVTFIASASAVLLVQGVPVFADVVEETCQLDPEDVERKITPRTRAIMVVHYGGYPADMDRILKVARRHRLPVVEDCAHAHGSEWRGRKVGCIGKVGTFSFQQSKSLTCGEGGAVVTDDPALHEAAYAYHHIGRVLGSGRYEHTSIGPNLRMTELQAALLRTQLRKLPAQNRRRERCARFLRRGLAELPGIYPLPEDPRVTGRGYYFFVMRFEEEEFGVRRDDFVAAMRAEGAPVGVGYGQPVYRLPAFREMSFGRKGCPLTCRHYRGRMDYDRVRCPVAEELSYRKHLTLPAELLLEERNAGLFLEAARKVYRYRDELRRPAGRGRSGGP